MPSSLASPHAQAPRRMRRRTAFIALTVLFLAAIVLLTMLPPEAKQFLHTRGRFHSAAHILAFTALAFALGRTTRHWTTRLLMLLGLLFFGFCTEYAEHYLFTIGLEWKDIGGDSVGSLLGLSLAALTQKRRHRPSPEYTV